MENQGEPLEVQVGILLRQRGLTLALAESCTGGMVSNLITNIPGSSDYFLGGVVAYAYEAKEQLLGVRHDTLLKHGAVSPETALEMANGIRHELKADIAASITGIAGPGGGMPNKPVGLVWMAISSPIGDRVFRYIFKGDRIEIKKSAAEQILRLLVTHINEMKLDG
jgi:PncC family amidohydrolase